MLSLSDITLVTVTSVNCRATVQAMKHCMRLARFGRALFISHERPRSLPSTIDFEQCDRISSINEYSRFMIYDLDAFIESPYCLTIHLDGFVVNPSAWRPEFLDYDYIGAPWPITDTVYIDHAGNHIRVGNGGFSLRSKRLLGIARSARLDFKAYGGFYNEDGFVCVDNRETYLKNGIRFAPLEVARHFSHEQMIPELAGITPFGFHGYRGPNRAFPRYPGPISRFFSRAQKSLEKRKLKRR